VHTWDPLGITSWTVAQFQRAWEARKKRGFTDFGLYPLVYREFLRAESGKSFVFSPTSKAHLADFKIKVKQIAHSRVHFDQWNPLISKM
jgi:hypothetical protein